MAESLSGEHIDLPGFEEPLSVFLKPQRSQRFSERFSLCALCG